MCENHSYYNGWHLFKMLQHINVHLSTFTILIFHGEKRRVKREFFFTRSLGQGDDEDESGKC